MPRRRRAALGALIGVSLISGGCTTGLSLPPGLTERPIAAVYRGPAACQGCPEAVASVLETYGDFAVEFVGPDENRSVTSEELEDFTLYLQPGGHDDVGLAMEQLGTEATDAISHWVEEGGGYVGFCMGAYLAGSDPGMELLSPGDTSGYAESAGSLVDDSDETVIPVEWNGEQRYQYAQEAAVIVASGVEGEEVLSRYTNGEINALVRPVGEGAVGVVGTHPEASDDWFSAAMAVADIDGLDHDQAWELVDAVMELR